MKLFFFSVVFFFFWQAATSQIDESWSGQIPSELQNPMNVPTGSPLLKMPKNSPSLTNPKYRNGIKIPSALTKEKDKETVLSTKTDLLTRTIDFKPAYLDQFRDSGGKGNQKTQYLGEFSSTGRFVEIYCRDHEYVDGDIIQVLLNNEIVVHSQVLSGSFQPILVTLEKGANRIEFKALNEGTSSPNTAEFIIYDEYGQKITHDRWNLARGVKASVLIQKP